MTAELRPITGVRESIEDLSGTTTEYSYITPTEETLRDLTRVLFEEHWRDIVVGPRIEGAVFEIRFAEAPKKVSVFDGYLTVDLGHWHFHLCIGPHKGTKSVELASKRRVSKLALFEQSGSKCMGGGSSYGVRLWNGFDEQMTTVLLPNPKLSDELKVLKQPEWERLRLWYELRNQFLGEPIPESFGPLAAQQSSTLMESTAPELVHA